MFKDSNELRRKYHEAFLSGEVVFGGQPLSYFTHMNARRLYEYKEEHDGFENSWVFRAILQDKGPVFNLIAKHGDDAVPSHT